MRGRDFLMKDAYSFDVDRAGAQHSYNKVFVAYLRPSRGSEVDRCGRKAVIGGDMSHEFIILASTGESRCSVGPLGLLVPGADVNFDDIAGLRPRSTNGPRTMPQRRTSRAAAFRQIPADKKQVSARGIEVGQSSISAPNIPSR